MKRQVKKRFRIPNQAACAEAIGVVWKKDKKHGRKLQAKHTELYTDEKQVASIKPFLDPTLFSPIDLPKDGDWLDEFPEEGQTFNDFAKEKIKKPSHDSDTIYVVPLGDFNSPHHQIFCKTLHRYASLFFCMRVQMLESVDIADNKSVKSRVVPYSEGEPRHHQHQYLTKDLLRLVGKSMPKDTGYCAIGITMEDLYPEEDWNFVFGEATDKGYGVFSFARYSPAFYNEPHTILSDKLLLERSLKVMVHEIGHMFGLAHCIYYKCIMNGSNSLEEEDATPFHLCPICLRKLHFSIDFDVSSRYSQLLAFYELEGFGEAASWVKQWM